MDDIERAAARLDRAAFIVVCLFVVFFVAVVWLAAMAVLWWGWLDEIGTPV
jgi:hypothetical protein